MLEKGTLLWNKGLHSLRQLLMFLMIVPAGQCMLILVHQHDHPHQHVLHKHANDHWSYLAKAPQIVPVLLCQGTFQKVVNLHGGIAAAVLVTRISSIYCACNYTCITYFTIASAFGTVLLFFFLVWYLVCKFRNDFCLLHFAIVITIEMKLGNRKDTAELVHGCSHAGRGSKNFKMHVCAAV